MLDQVEGTFRALVVEALEGAERRYARWDRAAFEARALPALERVVRGLSADVDADRRLVTSYARALVEASGRGWLVGGEGGEPWGSLLAQGLLGWSSWLLARGDREARIAWLAQLWNLGEGLLLEEPAWLNRYVAAQASQCWSDPPLVGWLEGVLEPVMRTLPDAAWTGPFETQRLDLGAWEEGFLPGAFHLPTPSLLYVQNQLDAEQWLMVLLQRGGESRVVGEDARVEAPEHPGPRVPVSWSEDAAEVGPGRVRASMRLLGRPERWLLHPAGFLIASAEDSQLLWIAESP